ncbi:probable G-protein coupled receptor CG31760 isoform X1 [Pocillopora damicornis]|uniref:probable G-protein coupled receptor CG31760 isoform X1 n=1 Tax=Pocillopora damicornis TaxID=46731 RepID=UPI000F552F20|nr:probable G-protein coupled receptor CG31760 isoform X1 [Pocillopora damicornis]
MKTKLAQLWGLVYYLLLAGFDYGSRGIIFAEANTDRNLKHGEEISDTHRDHLKEALRKVEKVRMAKNNSCQSNESVILDIGFENARWKSEALLAVEVANLLTSLKRVKTADGFSMVENDTLLYNIVRSNVRFSPSVFGSVICFEKNQYRDYERFCPYAFRDKTYNGSIHVKDIAVDHDYLTSPETIWWWEPRSKNVNRTVIPNAEEIYSIRLNRTTAETPHTKTVPVVCYDMDGHWTRPYFDCFGGHIWMTTFLAPFFNESNQFLGVVSIDVELSSIDINQCDAPDTLTKGNRGKKGTRDRTGKLLDFLGTHKCKPSTQCEPIANQGFKRGSYRCICRRGYYFPHPNSDTKYFNGSEIEEEYDKKVNKETNLYDDEFKCLPCSEGCDECSDDSPCMYKVNLISRVVLISINTLAAILAIVSGLVVYIFRESEVFEVSSPIFLQILLFGAISMYSSLGAAYVDPSSLSCTIEVWLYKCGFFLVYGILTLKAWRVSVSFRARSPRRVDVTDGMIAGRLALLCAAAVVFLIVWTLFMPPQVKHSTGDLRFKQCEYSVMNYVSLFGELILLVGAMFLCFRVRNAPSAYNETRFTSWAVYNAIFITCFDAVLRILTADNTNPDILFATEFMLIQMTASVAILLLFVPKFWFLRKMRGKEVNRRLTADRQPSDSPQTPNGSCSTDVATLERENKDLKDEVRRLSSKVAFMHSRLMKDKNKHIKSGTNSLCRARSSTNDDLEDGTLKRISKLPGTRFLNSRV